MPRVNIHCPACNKVLEIEEDAIGHEVECGECLEIFVAREEEKKSEDRGKASPAGKKSRKKSRRRDEEDGDDFDFDYDSPRRSDNNSGGGPNAAAITGLVLGIISMPLGLCCWIIGGPLSIIAILLGVTCLKQKGSAGLGIVAIVTGAMGLILSAGLLILGIGVNLLQLGR